MVLHIIFIWGWGWALITRMYFLLAGSLVDTYMYCKFVLAVLWGGGGGLSCTYTVYDWWGVGGGRL